MTLSADTRNRLQFALANRAAADELNQSVGFVAGTTYYVNSTNAVAADALSRAGTSFDEPFATLDYAIGRCTASQGDTIVLLPGHAETTTAIAADVAGIRIVGVGWGRLRPTLTATTGATDLLNVTAANVRIENVRFVGAASGCTALLDLQAVDFSGERLRFEHGAAPLIAVTVGTGASRFELIDCEWYGTAAGPDVCIDIETGSAGAIPANWSVIRPRANYGQSAGLDLAFLRSVKAMTGYRIEDPIVVGFDTLVIDINSSSAAVGDGVMVRARCVASAGVTIANVNDVGGMAAVDCQYTDAVTASGAKIPATTAS